MAIPSFAVILCLVCYTQFGCTQTTEVNDKQVLRKSSLQTCALGKLKEVHSCYGVDGSYQSDVFDAGFVERGTVCRHIICGVLQNAECTIAGRWVGHDGIEIGIETDHKLCRPFSVGNCLRRDKTCVYSDPPRRVGITIGCLFENHEKDRSFQIQWRLYPAFFESNWQGGNQLTCHKESQLTQSKFASTNQLGTELLQREKRGWRRSRRWFRRRRTTSPPPTYKPPSYTKCPPEGLPKEFMADIKQTSVKVTWKDPTTSTNAISNTHISGPRSGEFLEGLPEEGRKYSVTYVAKDKRPTSVHCIFNFYVKYIRCADISGPENGKKTGCTHGYIYGSDCNFACNTGFELHGSTKATCQATKQWTPKPTCKKLRCSEPFDLANGRMICDSQVYEFEDSCYFECNPGFILIGKQKMICQASQVWSASNVDVTCQDDTPPIIDCEPYQYQIFYANRGVDYTIVYWKEPTVTDNVDPNPSLVNVAGPKQGDTLTEGTHYVKYVSADATGNTQDCQLPLDVIVIKCESGPRDVLSNSQFLQQPVCNGSSYFYGVHCTLACELNLPLRGSETMICEKGKIVNKGVWSYGNGTEPYCEYVDCPPLDPPVNGGLVYNTIQSRPLYTMICPVGLDSPYMGPRFTGDLTCQDDGSWFPLEAFPIECVESSPFNMVLSSELLFEGDCSDSATQEMIKLQMLEYLSGIEEDFKNSICPDVTTCSVSNLVVVCGSARRRRSEDGSSFVSKHTQHSDVKRQTETDHAIVYWDTEILFVAGDKSDNEAYAYYLDVFEQITTLVDADIQSGDLNMTGFALPALKTSVPTFRCDPGYTRVNTNCKPCSRGMYLNSSTENCEFCPIGMYNNDTGAAECEPCPTGYSTSGTGSTESKLCIKMCQPGFVSYNTIEPCVSCPHGSYQPLRGEQSCIVCPVGTTTAHTNSTAESECQYFDMKAGNLQENRLHVPINSETSVITIRTWLKLQSTVSPALSIHLGDSEGRILSMELHDMVSFTVGGTLVNTSVQLSVDYWTHVLATLDMLTGSLHVYRDSELISSTNGFHIDSTRQFSNGSAEFETLNESGMLLSGFAIHPVGLSAVELEQVNTMCQYTIGSEVLAMDDIRDSHHDEIKPILPSSCDPINECEDNPCGDFPCVNKVGTFTCICKGGWSGQLCDIPPDYCIGNACENGDCISTNETYVCKCSEWYTGVLCNDPPVNGGWSEWDSWRSCDVTCGGGTAVRNRRCENPLPGPGGIGCMQQAIETKECNTRTCPACPPLKSRPGTAVHCIDNLDNDLKECNSSCVDGKTTPPGQTPPEKYSCGPSTGYEWQPTDKLVPCIDFSPPMSMTVNAEASYTVQISNEHEHDVKEHVNNRFKDKACVQSGMCDLIITLHSEKRGKRATSSSAIFITVTTVFENLTDIGLDDYFDIGTVSPSLEELQNAEDNLEEMSEFIQNNTEDIFTITIGDEVYNIDIDTLYIDEIVQCSRGYGEFDGVCVQCPEGTYENIVICQSCDIGSYQSMPGQTSCDVCPYGYTSLYYGSTDESQCSIPLFVDSTTSAADEVQITSEPHKVTHFTIIVAASVTGVFVLVLTIAACVVYKKHFRKKVRQSGTNGSFISINMVKPTQQSSMTNVDN